MAAYKIRLKRELSLKLNRENNTIMLVEFIRRFLNFFQY